MPISHDEGFDEDVIVVAKEDNVLRLQLASRDEALLAFPPTLNNLAGCSPSYFTFNSSPFPFRQPMDDKIIVEDETKVSNALFWCRQ